ncbi:MAG: 3D domain-containing protein, partial [Halobacteriovoraceae bacterium]|nr:3D domain-containing protein [Halobacteriovoraceae bacterium]
ILPDGSETVHDGYFFAGDTGGAIKGTHIDVYIGVAKKNPFSWVKSNSSGTFKAKVVNDPVIKQVLTDLHLK